MTEEADIPPRLGIVEAERPRLCEICRQPISGNAIWWKSDGTWFTAHPSSRETCSDRLVLLYLTQRLG